MQLTQTEEHVSRLEIGGAWIVEQGCVNLDDLLHAMKPGQVVVRTRGGVDKIRFIPASDTQMLGCMAGWISEEH